MENVRENDERVYFEFTSKNINTEKFQTELGYKCSFVGDRISDITVLAHGILVGKKQYSDSKCTVLEKTLTQTKEQIETKIINHIA